MSMETETTESLTQASLAADILPPHAFPVPAKSPAKGMRPFFFPMLRPDSLFVALTAILIPPTKLAVSTRAGRWTRRFAANVRTSDSAVAWRAAV